MKIVQKRWPFMTLKLEVKDQSVIVTSESRTAYSVETHFLGDLSHYTERHFEGDMRWLAAAAVLALVAIPFIIDAATLGLGTDFFFACGLIAGAIACAIIDQRLNFERVCFKRYPDDKTAFVMWYNKPDPNEYNKFYDYLRAKIHRANLKWRERDNRKLPTKLPKASDFPVGSYDYQFRIKELEIPLVYVQGQGWFNWIEGEPSGPFENVEFKQGNNDCVDFEEWVELVEECLKDRWINRIFAGAGIDRHSWDIPMPHWILGSTLQTFSKKFKERYRWKNDADGVSRELGPAECILLVSILASGMPEIIEHLTAELRGRPDVDAAAFLASLRKPAFELAKQELPDVLVSTTAGQLTLPFSD